MAPTRIIIDPENMGHIHRLASKLYANGMGVDALPDAEVDDRYAEKMRQIVFFALRDYSLAEVD